MLMGTSAVKLKIDKKAAQKWYIRLCKNHAIALYEEQTQILTSTVALKLDEPHQVHDLSAGSHI